MMYQGVNVGGLDAYKHSCELADRFPKVFGCVDREKRFH